MYRQYENPRTLEQELAEKKSEYDALCNEGKLDGEEMYDMYMKICDLEDRVNFAYQDEEYDEIN